MAGPVRLDRPGAAAGRRLTASGAAAARWRDELEAWAIPAEILEQAPESPWSFPVEPFVAKAEGGRTVSHRRALEALPEGGRVLDVGIGGGAMSRPLRPQAGWVVGVDAQESMLAASGADETVLGRWPAMAAEVASADVVVCGHVFYNVADLGPFVGALTDKAARVVVEITAAHPLVGSGSLWRRFWGIERPAGPVWQDALAVLAEVGVEARVDTWTSAGGVLGFPDLAGLVAFTRRRLCLPASRDDEVRGALMDSGAAESHGRWVASAEARPLVTLWWDG